MGARDELDGHDPGPQRDLWRTVQQTVDAVPPVPFLDDPAPQMVDQLQDIMRFFDTLLPVPAQVIEVPKILLDDVSMRTAVRDTQLAEQLVEVPTIVSYSWLQLSMEQNVDIPVPGRGGRIAGLQGFLPRQSSTALCMFLRNAFLSGLWSRSLISPFLVETSKIFAQDRVHPLRCTFQLVFMKSWMSLVKVFAHFSPK